MKPLNQAAVFTYRLLRRQAVRAGIKICICQIMPCICGALVVMVLVAELRGVFPNSVWTCFTARCKNLRKMWSNYDKEKRIIRYIFMKSCPLKRFYLRRVQLDHPNKTNHWSQEYRDTLVEPISNLYFMTWHYSDRTFHNHQAWLSSSSFLNCWHLIGEESMT